MNTTFATPAASSTPSSTAPAPRAAATAPAAPRMDMYVSIHKALRAFMMDTLYRVGRMDVHDTADHESTLAQVDALLTFCANHLKHENEFVHAAIEARQPAGARRTADDHAEHVEAIDALRAETSGLRRAEGGQRMLLALRLYRHLALFVAENFQHMHIEETANNAVLWANYSDAELVGVHDALVASIPPDEQLIVARWMVPALSPFERAMVMGGMKNASPPEAFLGLMSFLRPHLDDSHWTQLARAVGVDPGLGRQPSA